MLSQRITQKILLIHSYGAKDQTKELAAHLVEWKQAHQKLSSQGLHNGLSELNTENVAALYAQLTPYYNNIIQTAQCVINSTCMRFEPSVLLDSSDKYLVLMNKIVNNYENINKAKIIKLRWIEFSILALTLLLLLLESQLIFRPLHTVMLENLDLAIKEKNINIQNSNYVELGKKGGQISNKVKTNISDVIAKSYEIKKMANNNPDLYRVTHSMQSSALQCLDSLETVSRCLKKRA